MLAMLKRCLSVCQISVLPALHLHHEGLFDGDPAAVDDHTLRVREVPLVGVLQLDGVKHRLQRNRVWLERRQRNIRSLCVCVRRHVFFIT